MTRSGSKKRRFLRCLVPAAFVLFLFAVGAGSFLSMPAAPFRPDTAEPADGEHGDFEERFESANPLRETLIRSWNRLRYLVFGDGLPGVLIGSDGYLFTEEEWYAAPADFDSADPYAIIADVHETLSRRGIELVVVPVPAKNRILAEFSPLPVPHAVAARYREIVTRLRGMGICTADIEAAFLNDGNPGTLYLRTDTHWTPRGAQTAARAVFEAAASSGADMLYTRESFTNEKTGMERFCGDLFEFLPLPNRSDPDRVSFGPFRRYLPEPDMLDTYATERTNPPQLGLFDVPVIPLALTGTSYSASENWNFGGFLMEEFGADLMNTAEEGRGPFEPMLALLENAAVAEAGVRIVIWEIPERYIVPAGGFFFGADPEAEAPRFDRDPFGAEAPSDSSP